MRAEPADDLHRSVSRGPRRHPDRRPRQDGRRLADAVAPTGRGPDARPLVPHRRLRHPLRRQVAHLPRRPPRCRGHSGSTRTTTTATSFPMASRPTAAPIGSTRSASPVGSAPNRTAASCAMPAFVAIPLIADRVVAWLEDRYARRAAGDPDALRPFLLVASFVNPHDIVLFPAWARRRQPDRAVTARSATRPRGTHAARGPRHEAGGTDRVSRDVPLRVRAGPCCRRDVLEEGAGVPRPLSPVARRGRCPARPGAARRHRARHRRRHRADVRPRRPARRARRTAPEVVQPVRRGDPGAVLDRSGRNGTDDRRGRGRRADLARRHRPDAARRGRDRRVDRGRRAGATTSPRSIRCPEPT